MTVTDDVAVPPGWTTRPCAPLNSVERAILARRAGALGLDIIDLAELSALPRGHGVDDALLRRCDALIVGAGAGEVVIALTDPEDLVVRDDLRAAAGVPVRFVVGSRRQIRARHEEARAEEGEHGSSTAGTLARRRELDLRSPSPHAGSALGGAPGGVETLMARLRSRNLLSAASEDSARRHAGVTGRSLVAALGELSVVADAELLGELAALSACPAVDLDQLAVNGEVAGRVPETVARRYHVLALDESDGRIRVATADPFDLVALDDLRSVLQGEVTAVVASWRQIGDWLERTYGRQEATDRAAASAARAALRAEGGGALVTEISMGAEDAPVVRFVNLVLAQALAERASDVHLEPQSDELVVRLRVDGVLHTMTRAPASIHASVVTRLKVIAGLDIAEHRVPQDGRISLQMDGRAIDLRVATLPTVHGEKVVLRVLDKRSTQLELGRLGFRPEVLERYESAFRRPSGVLLVTGPTGSGKSTTLYATLAELNVPERHLITVEDPVEYRLAGVNQVQVNPKAGLHFANALRSILRADPDVVLVGEIRDEETAAIAVGAALTGHLVLSCLHTNDAAAAPQRLVEMGVEPFLVGSAIDAVLAQRLVRVLCDHCAEPVRPGADDLAWAGPAAEVRGPGAAGFRRAVGCPACAGTGYRGRMAVQELLVVTEEVERAILTRATREEIHRIAVAEGMTPMRQDGFMKAALGMTSLEEIQRVVS